MNVWISLALLCCVVIVSAQNANSDWEGYKTKFSKAFSSSSAEAAARVAFRQKQASIQAHNAEADQGLYTYKKGMNPLSVLPRAQFQAMLGAKIPAGEELPDPVYRLRVKADTLPTFVG
jgi:hypothetical protein